MFFTPKQQYVTKVSIIYSSEMGYLDELCLSMPDISRASAITPHIGETFIDRKRKEEYEVKDIIRSFNNGEYIIQVQLKKREHKRYNI